MKNKKSIILSFIAIILITIGAIILNLAKDFETTLKTGTVTIVYLISWIVFINIGLKNKVKSVISFYYLIWGITFVTSVILIIGNAIPYLADYFTFAIVLVPIFITPISGLAFSDSNLMCAIVYLVASTIVILIPTIKNNYNKLKENR